MENENLTETVKSQNTTADDSADPRKSLDLLVAKVEESAEQYEQQSMKMVRRSIGFDAVTVVFGAASPALTTYIA